MDLEQIIKNKKLTIVFMGTASFAVPILEGLVNKYGVRMIVSQPNRAKKDGVLIDTPIKKFGDDKLILVLQPDKIEESVEEILGFEPDLIITCAYGQKLPKEILDYPRLGCINVHASLLPKLRGGAPVQRAIMKGFKETGISIIEMIETMDGGDIIAQNKLIIEESDNASSLSEKLSKLGRDLLLETMPSILSQSYKKYVQDKQEVTYAITIKKNDEKLDLTRGARELFNKIRGLADVPGAYCLFDNKRLKVFKSSISDNFFARVVPGEITGIYENGFGVKVGNREIIFEEVQIEGGKRMLAIDFIHGVQNQTKIIGKILR